MEGTIGGKNIIGRPPLTYNREIIRDTNRRPMSLPRSTAKDREGQKAAVRRIRLEMRRRISIGYYRPSTFDKEGKQSGWRDLTGSL